MKMHPWGSGVTVIGLIAGVPVTWVTVTGTAWSRSVAGTLPWGTAEGWPLLVTRTARKPSVCRPGFG